jgi:predicted acetyltransferase
LVPDRFVRFWDNAARSWEGVRWTLLTDFSLSKIGVEPDPVLRGLFRHYLEDMAEWFAVDPKADASYAVLEQGYDAYLAKVGDSIGGFALIGSADGLHDVHEFFVLRGFRRRGVGHRMATALWEERRGGWLVRVLAANSPAVLFWRTAIASYSRGSYEEEGRMVNGRLWRFFRFVSEGR